MNAAALGANAFALFTKNQKRWLAEPLTPGSIDEFALNMSELGFSYSSVLPHDGYLINLAHPDPDKLDKSRDAFVDEMRRCEALSLKFLNFHPGSALDGNVATALPRVSESINLALGKTGSVAAVIENTAGQGNNVGYRLEHLAEIIDGVEDKSRVGVCVDTCHAFAAGYELRGEDDLDIFLEKFDSVIGLEYLRGMHLNDSKNPLGSCVDRHESLGEGTIGLGLFERIARDARLDGIPLILETPHPEIWSGEIDCLRKASEVN